MNKDKLMTLPIDKLLPVAPVIDHPKSSRSSYIYQRSSYPRSHSYGAGCSECMCVFIYVWVKNTKAIFRSKSTTGNTHNLAFWGQLYKPPSLITSLQPVLNFKQASHLQHCDESAAFYLQRHGKFRPWPHSYTINLMHTHTHTLSRRFYLSKSINTTL